MITFYLAISLERMRSYTLFQRKFHKPRVNFLLAFLSHPARLIAFLTSSRQNQFQSHKNERSTLPSQSCKIEREIYLDIIQNSNLTSFSSTKNPAVFRFK